MYSLRKINIMRAKKLSLYTNNYVARAGGSFHGPTMPNLKKYENHRKITMEHAVTTFWHDNAPEYMVNLHSVDYPSAGAAVSRIIGTFIAAIPIFAFGMWVSKTKIKGHLWPRVSNNPDHAHRGPRLVKGT